MDRSTVSRTTNKVVGVIAFGAVLVIVVHFFAVPAFSAPRADQPVKYPQWYTGLKEIEAAATAKKYKDALALAMRLADAPGIPPQKAVEIHADVVNFALQVKDYATAAAMIDRMLAADEGNRLRILETCVLLAVLQNRIARAQDCTALFVVALEDARHPN